MRSLNKIMGGRMASSDPVYSDSSHRSEALRYGNKNNLLFAEN